LRQKLAKVEEKNKVDRSGGSAGLLVRYKGHGPKVYFNSEQLEVLSYEDDFQIERASIGITSG
jgi:hypothetical protein